MSALGAHRKKPKLPFGAWVPVVPGNLYDCPPPTPEAEPDYFGDCDRCERRTELRRVPVGPDTLSLCKECCP